MKRELRLAALEKLLPGTTVRGKVTNSTGIVTEHNFGFALPEVLCVQVEGKGLFTWWDALSSLGGAA